MAFVHYFTFYNLELSESGLCFDIISFLPLMSTEEDVQLSDCNTVDTK